MIERPHAAAAGSSYLLDAASLVAIDAVSLSLGDPAVNLYDRLGFSTEERYDGVHLVSPGYRKIAAYERDVIRARLDV